MRRVQVEDSMKELERRLAETQKVSLETRITQAGLSWTKQQFLIGSGIVSAVVLVGAFVGGLALLPAIGFAAAAGFGLPALGVELSQKAPRGEVSQCLARCRRCDRTRHQGRLARCSTRSRSLWPTRRNRCAASSTRSSRPRPSACRSVKPASGCTTECRCRKPTSSAS